MKVTGHRKGDVCPAPDEVHGPEHMSRASVIWFVHGLPEMVNMTPRRINLLNFTTRPVTMATVPGPSKADQTGERYGNFMSYCPLIRHDATNAAWRMLQYETTFPVYTREERKRTPLFGPRPGIAFSHSYLDNMLKRMLTYVADSRPDLLLHRDISKYSWHSLRIALACALLSLRRGDGSRRVDDATIQAMCRWATVKSLATYARLSKDEYSSLIVQAAGAQFSSVQAASLWKRCPWIDNDHRYAFLEAFTNSLNADKQDDDREGNNAADVIA